MYSVLFVCTANICRSPMAEGLLKALSDGDTEPWRIESAGVWAIPGQPAALFTRQVLQDRGIRLLDHISKPVTRGMVSDFNVILTMERRHKEAMRAAFPEDAARILTLSELVGKAGDIDDPVNGSIADYEQTAQEIERILNDGFERLCDLAVDRL